MAELVWMQGGESCLAQCRLLLEREKMWLNFNQVEETDSNYIPTSLILSERFDPASTNNWDSVQEFVDITRSICQRFDDVFRKLAE